MKLTTKRLILRDLKQGDQESVRKHVNNLEISKWLLVVPYPYTKKDADWWINHCLDEQKKKQRDYTFGITIKPDNQIIGGVSLNKIDKFQGTATMGYWLSEDYWRKGYMSEAVMKMIGFAFSRLKLRRVVIKAFTKNKASNNLAKKLGFKFEGTLRKACKAKATGKIHNEHLYSLLKNEWKKK
tara:strand:+ start:501 stop:1049 length:549 start_codon:yes stop_codon:yes gene_type:complete